MILNILQGIGTAGGILGALLVSLKRPWAGHIVWFFSNASWAIYGILAQNWYLLTMFGVYWCIACIGCVNYRPKKSEEKSVD